METFNPVEYSNEELTFLKTALGKSPTVAFADGVPTGVVPTQVRPLLQYVKDMEDMGRDWAGIPAVIETIETWEAVQSQVKAQRTRGAPRWPSMFSYDSKGRPHRGGPGSDSSKIITYFNADGTRSKLAISLEGAEQGEWRAPWKATPTEAPKELIEREDAPVLECAVCKHTEQYKEDSQGSYRAARARMSKHMKQSNIEPDLHREYKLNVFGS